MTSPRHRRFGARLAAASAVGALAAGALALPAAAQSIDAPDVHFQFESLIVPGGERDFGAIEIDFGSGFPTDTHTVGANLQIHTDLDGFEFDATDAPGECEKGDTGVQLVCTQSGARSYTFFGFEYWANDLAESGVYDYTLTITVDSETVKSMDGHIEIADTVVVPGRPFRHGDLEITDAEPGGAVEVAPRFLQKETLHEETAAIVVTFGDPHARVGMDLEGAEATAGYDNCFDGIWSSDRGITCVITDYEDSPGGLFTFSGPVVYEIDQTAPGPVDICNCTYGIRTVDAATLESDFGGVFWDESSADLLGLEPADSWEGPSNEFDAPYMGTITIVTSEHPFDLAVGDVNVEGGEGEEVTVNVPVTNLGPAAAHHRIDFYGSYTVRGQLPEGLELVAIDSEDEADWACLSADSLEIEYGYQEDRTELERFDFACYFERLGPEEAIDFTFTVAITDAAEATDGLIETREVYPSLYTASLDGDLANNLAVIGVNAADLIEGDEEGASGKLPVTGTSMTIAVGAAAAALAAGAVMFVLVRRRKAAADW